MSTANPIRRLGKMASNYAWNAFLLIGHQPARHAGFRLGVFGRRKFDLPREYARDQPRRLATLLEPLTQLPSGMFRVLVHDKISFLP